MLSPFGLPRYIQGAMYKRLAGLLFVLTLGWVITVVSLMLYFYDH